MEASPPILEYRFPASTIATSDPETRLTPFTVHVLLEPLLDNLRREVERAEQAIAISQAPPGWPPEQHRECAEKQSVLAWLTGELNNGFTPVVWNPSLADHVAIWVTDAVFQHQFTTLYCEACEHAYGPTEIAVARWEKRQNKWDAYGGLEASCPRGHSLLDRLWLT